jgi:hypothetical protein
MFFLFDTGVDLTEKCNVIIANYNKNQNAFTHKVRHGVLMDHSEFIRINISHQFILLRFPRFSGLLMFYFEKAFNPCVLSCEC